MRGNLVPASVVSVTLIAIMAIFATSAAAQLEKVLYSFPNSGKDAEVPNAGVIFDKAGNLYGTTADGGIDRAGAVFELTPQADGSWSEKVLHSFAHNDTDGRDPLGGLVIDAAGNLYGTTFYGGTNDLGTVFELVQQANGTWSEKILYSFRSGGSDGACPETTMIFDAAGNLYGTTLNGGNGFTQCTAVGGGIVFELTPKTGGDWAEKILHRFGGSGLLGANPSPSLIFDAAGNLYGTTSYGGSYGYGTAFELTRSAEGKWTEKLLHSFSGTNGGWGNPYAGLVFGPAGNLYGTTYSGGSFNFGTVFKPTQRTGRGEWPMTVLHSFGNSGDGTEPLYGQLIFDAAGNLYGTTNRGGSMGEGAVFELTPAVGGDWSETVLHSFGSATDGTSPVAGLVLDGSGNLYGTTPYGGPNHAGIVFEITP